MSEEGNYLDLTPEQVASMIAKLKKQNLRIIHLMCLGLRDSDIAKDVGCSEGVIKQRINRSIKTALGLSGRGRETIVLWYGRHILPVDLQGVPADPTKRAYTQPGEKLADWTAAAVNIRAKLRAGGVLTPRNLEVVALLTNPEHVDKSLDELASLLPPQANGERPKGRTIHNRVHKMTSMMAKNGTRTKLVLVATLAPFDENDAP